MSKLGYAETFRARGSNSDVDAGTEDIEPTGALALPAAAAATTIVSASADDVGAGETLGTGARSVVVTGLLAGGVVSTETALLNGATPVTLTGVYLRILDAYVATAGSGETAAGAITIKHSSTVIGTIPAGDNKLNRAAYTVPANRRARLLQWRCQSGVAADGVCTFRLLARPSGGVWQVLDEVELADVTPGLPVVRDMAAGGIVLPALCDIKVAGTSSAANMDAWADFCGELEADF